MTRSAAKETVTEKPAYESYRGILKSTTLIGGASVLNILIGMVRTKFVAILLGPSGVGLLSLYNQITTLINTATGMGIGNSGVRQVAEAVGTEDNERIARTIITLRRTAWVTGGLGLLVMGLFCVPISYVTFKSGDYAWNIALLSATPLLVSVSAGQSCVLRGTRRIGDVAKITVISALFSTLVSVPCYYIWGIRGIIPSLILSVVASFIVSWWYARRVTITTVVMSWRESRHEARALLSLGTSFMGAALAGSATTYLIQVLLIRQFGLNAFGIYQAAFSLSGVLVGFVLNAMGSDYYPRLTAVSTNNDSVYRMVNEQTQISILLALPGLAAMMIFAPLIIKVFFAPTFVAAVPILRWCILGILGRVFCWPLGFVILAKGKGKLFLMTELVACGTHLAAVFFMVKIWGFKGAGIAFMALYFVNAAIMLTVVHKLVRRPWNLQTLKLVLMSMVVVSVLMINCTLNEHIYSQWILSMILILVTGLYCLYRILHASKIDIKRLILRNV